MAKVNDIVTINNKKYKLCYNKSSSCWNCAFSEFDCDKQCLAYDTPEINYYFKEIE